MSKLRVAVLEDEPEKLKHLVGLLRETQLVDVVAHSCLKDEFIQKVDAARPEALVLDIDLNGEPDGGIEVTIPWADLREYLNPAAPAPIRAAV